MIITNYVAPPLLTKRNSVSKKNNITQQQNSTNNAPSFGTNYPNFPTRVAVAINKSCNLKCSYCPNSQVISKIKEQLMPMDLFKKIMGSLKEIDFDGRFYFHTFNEPLFTKKAESYIEEANKNIPKAETRLYTNGMFLTIERLKNIQNSGGVKTMIVTEHTKSHSFLDKLPNIDDELLKGIYVRQPDDLNLVNRGGLLNDTSVSFENNPCLMPKRNLISNERGLVVFCPDDYHETGVLGDLNYQTPIEVIESKKYKDVINKLENGDRTIFPICTKCDRDLERHSVKIPAVEYKKMLLSK